MEVLMNFPTYEFYKKLYYVAVAVAIAGLLFLSGYHFFDYEFYGIKAPCVFKVYLSCYCPGCGGTRAVDALLHGKLLQSVCFHPVPVYVLAMFLAYFIPASYTFLIRKDGKIYNWFSVNWLWGLLIVLLVNFIGRNLLLWCFHIDVLGDIL